ncbi:peroxiredoxin [Richelia intracellularis]|uniref:peroxiredoxin n=1 Tax=Richelia intracellularis TaxID=1164990 RepID=UPI001E3BA072|nr:redoxin domain-containing protein [Richelia intracellularis]
MYFHPKNNNPACTAEAKEFAFLNIYFSLLEAIIVGISTDSAESHRVFIGRKKLSLVLLSDAKHHITEAYGLWQLKKFMGKEYISIVRLTFLIGTN